LAANNPASHNMLLHVPRSVPFLADNNNHHEMQNWFGKTKTKRKNRQKCQEFQECLYNGHCIDDICRWNTVV